MKNLNEAKETVKQFGEFRLDALSLDKQQELLDGIELKFSQINDSAEKSYNLAYSKLKGSDPDAIPLARKAASKFKSQIEELEDLKKKISDSINRKKIRNRMISRLGGDRNLKIFEFLIMVLIVFVLGLLIYDFTIEIDGRPNWLAPENIFWIDAVCCVIFMGEFFFRLSCADDKRFVWRHHWIDFVTSIPVPGEAQLARFGRFGRFARFLRLLRFLRFLRFFFLLWRGMDKFQDVLDVKLMKKTMKWGVIATILGAILVYQVEGIPTPKDPSEQLGTTVTEQVDHEGEAVGSLPKAIWWSFTTVLTGGFGDIHNPHTLSGQLLTGFLVITGMVLVGVFTATLTSIFVGEQSEELERLSESIDVRLTELLKKIEKK